MPVRTTAAGNSLYTDEAVVDSTDVLAKATTSSYTCRNAFSECAECKTPSPHMKVNLRILPSEDVVDALLDRRPQLVDELIDS